MYSIEKEFVDLMDKFRKLKSLDKILVNKLSFAEMIVLNHITEMSKDITVSNLSEDLKITKAAVSKLISNIEEKGFVERVEDKNDRRITHIAITPEGLENVEHANNNMEKHSKFIYEKMGEEDMKKLIELMKKLYKIMETEKKEKGKIDV